MRTIGIAKSYLAALFVPSEQDQVALQWPGGCGTVWRTFLPCLVGFGPDARSSFESATHTDRLRRQGRTRLPTVRVLTCGDVSELGYWKCAGSFRVSARGCALGPLPADGVSGLSPNSSRICGGSSWPWVAFGFVERLRGHIEDLVSGADMVTLGAVPPSKLLLPPHGRALVPSGVTASRRRPP